MSRWLERERCISCGKFVSIGAPGVSWSQSWSYDMTGTPDLHDPRYRCSVCTDVLGLPTSNCLPPERHQGRNPLLTDNPGAPS